MHRDFDYAGFCDEWLQSWTGNQPLKLLSFYTDDAFYLDPANTSGLNGKQEMSGYFNKLLARNPFWEWRADEIIPTEKGFTLKWKAIVPVDQVLLKSMALISLN